MRPANHQMGLTASNTGFSFNRNDAEDEFNTMVVLQPSVASCEIRAKVQYSKFLSSGLLLVVPKGLHDNAIILISTQQM